MTREELKEHCKKQIEMCEMWAKAKGENPCGKVYEEHKMILELLEQQPCEDAISRREAIKKFTYNHKGERILDYDCDNFSTQIDIKTVKEILRDLPSVKPQYTEAEIQKMQELEQAEIQKAYELGKAQEPCDDCISRQAVNKLLRDIWVKYVPMELDVNLSFVLGAIDEIESVTPARPKSEWIPVSERLPEDGTWAIFTDGSKISIERYKVDIIDHFFPEERWFSFDDATAWMPLPEPYGGERDE